MKVLFYLSEIFTISLTEGTNKFHATQSKICDQGDAKIVILKFELRHHHHP